MLLQSTRRTLRGALLVSLPAILGLMLGTSLARGAEPSALGETEFANSGAAGAQMPFLRGILLLHSFEYDDAREAFVAAREIDPGFAMASWGEAMTHNHPLWGQQDLEQARRALERLGVTPEERLAKAPTEREKDYLRAADLLFFGEGSKRERDVAFADAMGALAARYPEDLDGAAWHALALLGSVHGSRDFRTYMRAAAIVEEVFAKNPQHPGAAHYLIHSYDDPVHAPLGLRAARVYAEIAPAAAHALHMPTHIYLAAGMWDDVVRMNERSWAAGEARVLRKGLGPTDREYHSLVWLHYGYLQQGRYSDAERMLAIAAADVERAADSALLRNYVARMRSAHLADTRDWGGAAGRLHLRARPSAPYDAAVRFFDGWIFVGRNELGQADAVLAELADGAARGSPDARIYAKQLDALIRRREGKGEAARGLLEQAAELEGALPLAYGPPRIFKPSRELLGETLLELGLAEEAREQFVIALERTPGRARALLGLARAAEAAGDAEAAHRSYEQLSIIWAAADGGSPELDEVRQAVR